MRIVFGLLLIFAFPVSAASQKPLIEIVVENLKTVCLAPSDKGKYWEENIAGQGDINVKLIGPLQAGVKGEAKFSKGGVWEGVQQVLKERQADDNARYRQCVEKLTPLFLDKFVPPHPDPGSPDTNPRKPTSDFPGGSRRVYSAEFSTWPRNDSNLGSVKLGFGNSYVMEPFGNTWIGPGRSIDIPPLENDFVIDVRFQIERRNPSASLSFDVTGSGTDAESVKVYFDVWDNDNVTYSLERGRVRSGGGLPIPHVVTEETIASR